MAQFDTRSRSSIPSAQRTTSQSPSTRETPSVQISHEAIAKRAYEKFLARGGKHGNDLKDWLEAERELKAEINRNPSRN